jgi:hypothetical protein
LRRVGGVASSLLEQAHYHINERETEFDADAVRRLSLEGPETGRRALLEALAAGSDVYRRAGEHLKRRESQVDIRDLPIDGAAPEVGI